MANGADLLVNALARTEGHGPTDVGGPYDDLIRSKAAKYRLDPHLLGALVHVESSGRPGVVSSAGAVGLGQLMPGTARDLGVRDRTDPEQNLDASARYLRQNLDAFGGDERRALAAYNAGPGAVRAHGGVPPAAAGYVERVTTAAALRRRANPLGPDLGSRGGSVTVRDIAPADSLVDALARTEGHAPAATGKTSNPGTFSSSPAADTLVDALARVEGHPAALTTGGYTASSGARLSHPEIAGAFRSLVEAAQAEGIEVRLNSGDRDRGEQERIWNSAQPIPGNPNLRRQSNGLPVARPGTSPHERGAAADLAFYRHGERLDPRLVIPLAREHGFEWQGPSDPVHWNFRGARPQTLAELRHGEEAAAPARTGPATLAELHRQEPAAPNTQHPTPNGLRPSVQGAAGIPTIRPLSPPPGLVTPRTAAETPAATASHRQAADWLKRTAAEIEGETAALQATRQRLEGSATPEQSAAYTQAARALNAKMAQYREHQQRAVQSAQGLEAMRQGAPVGSALAHVRNELRAAEQQQKANPTAPDVQVKLAHLRDSEAALRELGAFVQARGLKGSDLDLTTGQVFRNPVHAAEFEQWSSSRHQAAGQAAAADRHERVYGPRVFDPVLQQPIRARNLPERVGRVLQTLPDIGLSQQKLDQVQADFRRLQVEGRAPLSPQLSDDPNERQRQVAEIKAGLKKAPDYLGGPRVRFAEEMQKLAGLQPRTPQENAQLQQQRRKLVQDVLDAMTPERVFGDLKARGVTLSPIQREALLQDLAWQRYSFARAPEVGNALGIGLASTAGIDLVAGLAAPWLQAGLKAAGRGAARGLEAVGARGAAGTLARIGATEAEHTAAEAAARAAGGQLPAVVRVGRALAHAGLGSQHVAAFGAMQAPLAEAVTNPHERLQDVPGQVVTGYLGGLAIGGVSHAAGKALSALGRRLLDLLPEDRPVMTRELAQQAGVTPQEAGQALDALAQEGHAERTPQGWRGTLRQVPAEARPTVRPGTTPRTIRTAELLPGQRVQAPSGAPAAPPPSEPLTPVAAPEAPAPDLTTRYPALGLGGGQFALVSRSGSDFHVHLKGPDGVQFLGTADSPREVGVLVRHRFPDVDVRTWVSDVDSTSQLLGTPPARVPQPGEQVRVQGSSEPLTVEVATPKRVTARTHTGQRVTAPPERLEPVTSAAEPPAVHPAAPEAPSTSPAAPSALEAAEQEAAARMRARQAQRQTVPLEAPAVPETPVPGRVVELPTAEIHADPSRFQYKVGVNREGVTGELRGVRRWNRNLAGVVLVWRDPENGLTYIVNGHHRLDLANRLGQSVIDARYIDAPDAATARYIGAAANVAEGRGTAVDAAKLFRESKATPEQIAEQGISLRGKLASDGLALANLDEGLWQRVFRGEMPVSRGVAIGAGLTDPAEQRGLVKVLEAAEKRGKRLTDAEVSEFVRQTKNAPTTTSTQTGLFGEEEVKQNLALEKAQLGSWVKETLARDKRTFGFVSRGDRPAELERGGNKINAEESGRIAGEAGQALEVFDRLSTHSGPLADALNDAARRMGAGEELDAIRRDLYSRVRSAVQGELAGRSPGVGQPAAGGSGPAGGGRPAAGSQPLGTLESGRAAGSAGSRPAEPVTPAGPPPSLADLGAEANGSLREDVLNHLRTGRTLADLSERLAAQGHDASGAAKLLADLQREGQVYVEGSGRGAVYRAGTPPRSAPGTGGSLFLAGEREGAAAQAQQGLDLGPEAKGPAPPRSQKVLSALDDAEQHSRKWLDENPRLFTGLDPETTYHLARIGAVKIARGAVKFADWSAQMVEDLGERVRPHLEGLWQAAQAHYHEHFREPEPRPVENAPATPPEAPGEGRGVSGTNAQTGPQAPAGESLGAAAAPERAGQRETGLAEQVTRREVQSGRLDRMPEKSGPRTLEEVQRKGEHTLDAQADPIGYAEEVARRAAVEGRPFSRDETGVVLAGKRRLLVARDEIGEKLAALPRTSPDRPRLLAQYDAAKARLRDFVDDVQKGVSEAGGVLSQVRAGVDVDTGNYRSVLAEVERVTGRGEHELTDTQRRTLKDLTDQVAAQDQKIRDFEQHLRDLQASGAVEEEARQAPRPSKRQSIRDERQAIFAEIESIIREASSKTHSLGSAAYDSARFGLAAGRLALSYAREGVATLEEVVQRVVQDFHARGVTVDRDQVVNELVEVTKGKPHDPTAAQERLTELKRQARREVELRTQIGNLRAGIPNASPARRPTMTARLAELVQEREDLLATAQGRDLAEQQRVRRRIEVLKSGQPAAPKQPGPTPSPELEALRAERDRLNKERLKAANEARRDQAPQPRRVVNRLQKALDEDAGTQPRQAINQRIKAQDRAAREIQTQIADLEQQLRTGNFTERTPRTRQVDAALEKLRERRTQLSRQVEARIQQLRPWTPGDVLQKIVVESALSNPKLPAVKSIGNAVSAALQFPERLARAAADVALARLQGRPREVYAAEAARGAAAYFSALPRAFGDMVSVLRTGTSGFERPGSAEFELPRREAPGGYATNFATRNVAAVRALFLRPAVEGEMAAQATRQALKAGLQGAALRSRTEYLLRNPTPEMLRNVERQSQFATFHGDLLHGEQGGPAERLIRGLETAASAEWPGGVRPIRFVAPFIRTTYEIMKAGTKYSPLGLADLLAKNSEGKVIGGTPEAATTIGRAAVGTALMGAFAFYAADGRLTGAAPDDAGARKRWAEDHIQPYSVLVGDRWVSYAHTGLPVVPLAQLAAMVDAYNRQGTAPTPQKVAALGLGFLKGTTQGVSHAGIFNAAGRLLDVLRDPKNLPDFIDHELAAKVPLSGALRGVAQMTDPEVRKPRDLGEQIKANVPGLSRQVPARTEGTGKNAVPVERATGPAAFSPLEVSLPSRPAPNAQDIQPTRARMDVFGRPVTPDVYGRAPKGSFAGSSPADPVVRELTRLGIEPGFVGEAVKVRREEVGLTRQQRDEYQQKTGQRMYDRLEVIVRSAHYRDQTDEARVRGIKRAITHARDQARRELARELRQAPP